MVIFDCDVLSMGGSIVFDLQQMKLSVNGVFVYLNVGELVVVVFECVKCVGGVVQGLVVELLNNYGYVGYLIDMEGNCVGLYVLKCY